MSIEKHVDCGSTALPPPFGDAAKVDAARAAKRARIGKWPCCVLIPIVLRPGSAPLEDPHVSLSRTFDLLRHEMDGVHASLKRALRDVKCFQLEFVNHGEDGEKLLLPSSTVEGKVFRCLGVSKGSTALRAVVDAVDEALSEWDATTRDAIHGPDSILHLSWGVVSETSEDDAPPTPQTSRVDVVRLQCGGRTSSTTKDTILR